MILKRTGFQRTYELTERLLPDVYSGSPTPLLQQQRTFIQAALRALGVATPRCAADYFRTSGRPHVPATPAARALEHLATEGEAIPITIAGLPGSAWLDPRQLPLLTELRAGRGQPTLTTLLSPFDNLIWYRPRTATLFGFEYRLECYTPAPKRRYGYYSLPILHRGRLIGRLDPSHNRRTGLLTIKCLHLEPDIRFSESMARAIAGALQDLARFIGATDIAISRSDPPETALSIQHLL
jgi:uncharacterized protein YcaQ